MSHTTEQSGIAACIKYLRGNKHIEVNKHWNSHHGSNRLERLL